MTDRLREEWYEQNRDNSEITEFKCKCLFRNGHIFEINAIMDDKLIEFCPVGDMFCIFMIYLEYIKGYTAENFRITVNPEGNPLCGVQWFQFDDPRDFRAALGHLERFNRQSELCSSNDLPHICEK